VTEADQDERHFIERLRARDERAFNELVRAYEQRVFRLVLRMLGRHEEAEDIAQEVFVQVFKAIDQFRGESKLGTWIYRIAINLCKNRNKYLARHHDRATVDLETVNEQGKVGQSELGLSGAVHEPDQLTLGYQIERMVQVAILELEPDFREVLILRDVEDLTYEEIMSITGLAEGTVKSRIHRARALLKDKVERATGEKIP
jgi:RNA polymerase sigma-70 factor (ECF subfamily)